MNFFKWFQITVVFLFDLRKTNWGFLNHDLPVKVNLCQKLSFLNQLTHNIMRDCPLNDKKNTNLQHVVNLYSSMNNLSSYCGLTLKDPGFLVS